MSRSSNPPTLHGNESEPPHEGRRWVIAGSLLGAAVFLLASALLYIQWARNDNPNAVILLEIDAPVDNAEVTLSPMYGASRGPLSAQFSANGDHRLIFHVPPGSYRLTVRSPEGDLLFPRNSGVNEIRAIAHAQSYVVLPASALAFPSPRSIEPTTRRLH